MEKITVIGTGFICEYMRNGMRAVCENLDLHTSVHGIKGTDRDVEKRAEQLGIPVSVGGTYGVLCRQKPTIIVLCCSPEAAQGIVDSDLKPYYEKIRNENGVLPDLYSFIPSPSAVSIYNDLGSDSNVVKILPNIMDKVCGYDMSPVGINYASYRADNWSEERKQILKKFLAPYGFTVQINDRDSLVLLTGKITSHVCYEVSYDIADVCAQNGFDVEINDIGNAMINAQHKILPQMPVLSEAGDDSKIPENLRDFFAPFMSAWFQGIRKFTTENADRVSFDEARHTDMCSFALNVFPIRHESRRQLRQDTKNAATKGGILERGIEYYLSDVSKTVKDGVSKSLCGEKLEDDYFENIRRCSYEISRQAYLRSVNLTKK